MKVVTHCPPIISHEKTLAVTAGVESREMYYFKMVGWGPNGGLQKDENGSPEYSGLIDFKNYWQH